VRALRVRPEGHLYENHWQLLGVANRC